MLRDLGELISKSWPVACGIVGLVVWAVTSSLAGPNAAAAVGIRVDGLSSRLERVELAVGKISEIAADVKSIGTSIETLETRSIRTWDAVNGLSKDVNKDLSAVKSDVAGIKAAQETRDRLLLPTRK